MLFYDLSRTQELAVLNGHVINPATLHQMHCIKRASWPAPPLSADEFAAYKFHPYGAEGGWSQWDKYFATATYLICGHIPSRQELKLIHGFIAKFPNDFKRSHVNHEFVLWFLTYLFIGFKGHPHDCFVHESNAVTALMSFISALRQSHSIATTSFLCTHREAKVGDDLNLLQSFIPEEPIRRAGALALALIQNVRDDASGSALFFQQGASAYATSSIFPEVTVKYLERGQALDMLKLLQYQRERVGSTLASIPGPRASARLVSLDLHTRRIERFLSARYGPDWRARDFTYEREDPLVEIAIDMVLPEIERMMPFFAEDIQPSFLAKKDAIIQLNCAEAQRQDGVEAAHAVRAVIEWFMRQHAMTITAKSVYEAAFYYLWGRYITSINGAFAVGFDRDFDRHQVTAWKLGASSVLGDHATQQIAPIYARRNPESRTGGVLVNLSFRQFWRTP